VRGELSVVLVEGFFDCMMVTQAGFSCVALMGSTMSKAQEELLAEHFGHVVVMLDGDEAGRRASEEIADRLQRVVYQVQLVELLNDVQPDQLEEDELQRLLRWDSGDTLKQRLGIFIPSAFFYGLVHCLTMRRAREERHIWGALFFLPHDILYPNPGTELMFADLLGISDFSKGEYVADMDLDQGAGWQVGGNQ
jgi:hypothetical protein